MSNYGYRLRVKIAAQEVYEQLHPKFKLFKMKKFSKRQVLTRMRKVNMSRYMGNVIKRIESGL